jgi:tetratricopeptide (TPR) repeat protein
LDKKEAKQVFLQADALYAKGDYDASLHLLQRLNREFPRQKHIMYSAALCLEQLGRAQESIALCKQLIERFQDTRAEAILRRFAGEDDPEEESILTPSGTRKLTTEDRRLIAQLMQDPANQTPLPAQKGSARVWLYSLGAAALLCAFLIATGAFVYFAPPAGPSTGIALSTNGETLSLGQVLVLFLASSVAANTITMYVLLSLMQHQRYESALDNIFDVLQYAFLITLLLLVPVVGWLAIPLVLRQHYYFSVGQLLLFLMLQSVMAVGFSIIFAALALLFGYGWVLRTMVGA